MSSAPLSFVILRISLLSVCCSASRLSYLAVHKDKRLNLLSNFISLMQMQICLLCFPGVQHVKHEKHVPEQGHHSCPIHLKPVKPDREQRALIWVDGASGDSRKFYMGWQKGGKLIFKGGISHTHAWCLYVFILNFITGSRPTWKMHNTYNQ